MGRHRLIYIAIHIPKGEATSMANQVSGCLFKAFRDTHCPH